MFLEWRARVRRGWGWGYRRGQWWGWRRVDPDVPFRIAHSAVTNSQHFYTLCALTAAHCTNSFSEQAWVIIPGHKHKYLDDAGTTWSFGKTIVVGPPLGPRDLSSHGAKLEFPMVETLNPVTKPSASSWTALLLLCQWAHLVWQMVMCLFSIWVGISPKQHQ